MAVTNTFSFTLLNGSDPAGHNSINALVNSIDTRLQALSSGLATASTSPGTLSTGQVLRWNGTSYANAFVDATSLASNAITTDKINALAVTTGKIADLNVTTDKIADDAVTLGTKTSGNYIATIAGTANQVSVSGSGVESGAVTLSIPSSPILPGAPTIQTPNGTYGSQTTNTSRAATIQYVNDAAASITAGTSFTVGGDLSGTTGNATIVPGAVTSDKILNNTIALGDLATALQALLVPTGTIAPFAGLSGSKPPGWFICDGSSFASNSLSAGNALYDLLVAAGWSALPDLRGRTIIGTGTGSGLTARTLRDALGDERLQAHTHTFTTSTVGNHTHGYYQQPGYTAASSGGSGIPRAADNNAASGGYPTATDPAGSHNHTGTTDAHNQSQGSGQNMQPSLVLNYIIKG
jgi:microcystin-dependent protein